MAKFPHRAILLAALLLSIESIAAEELCTHPIAEKDTTVFFERSARLQLQLEFGGNPFFISKIKSMKVGPTLVRVDGLAKIRKLGSENLSEKRITGWVERCQGVVIIRGNTWLADGTLVAPRYSREQLHGRGLVMGKQEAKLHLIAYVDSRCPHCHRLMSYVVQLVESGKITIEIRQTAFLESTKEALQDTRLPETSLVRTYENKITYGDVKTTDADYFEMLSGDPNESKIATDMPGYENALSLLEQNTLTARKILGITQVPALLVLDNKENGLYRLAGYWEMNRLLQPAQ